MQIKIINIPVVDKGEMSEELNKFLRSKKVLQTESFLVQDGQNSFWSFCIRYIETVASPLSSSKPSEVVDYKLILDEECFKRYTHLREIRKRVAQKEAIPVYMVFTNEELANLSKIETLTIESIQTVKGIGLKKIEKYAQYLIDN